MNWESRLVLVAEDSDDDYFLLTRAFQKANFHNPIQRVENGHEAILYLSGAAPYENRTTFPMPYVVLLDLKMPILHGFDVLVWMRQQASILNLPVVVFSSSQQKVDVHESYRKGANGFVTKPESMTGLVDIVAAIQAYWIKANRVEI
jgi:CheY-like chemotaxis protein